MYREVIVIYCDRTKLEVKFSILQQAFHIIMMEINSRVEAGQFQKEGKFSPLGYVKP